MPVPSFNPKRVKPETAIPRYRPSGDGRDIYIERAESDSLSIPRTGVIIVANRKDPKQKKFTTGAITGSTSALPNFAPNGTGRDLFQQVNPNPLVVHTGPSFSQNPPVSSERGLGVNRSDRAPPRYIPSGTGRDMFFTNYVVSTRASIRKEHPKKAPQSRTHPVPRFAPNGTGRDLYVNSYAEDEQSIFSQTPMRGGDSSPKVKGFAYGDDTISQNANWCQEKTLRRFNSRQGTTIKASTQREAIARLTQSPTRLNSMALTDPRPIMQTGRLDSPMAWSPVQLRASTSLGMSRGDFNSTGSQKLQPLFP